VLGRGRDEGQREAGKVALWASSLVPLHLKVAAPSSSLFLLHTPSWPPSIHSACPEAGLTRAIVDSLLSLPVGPEEVYIDRFPT
jgi:hypothetical protein